MFVYFVPAGTKKSDSGIPSDLAYAFEASPAQREVLRDGPDGGRGMLLCSDASYLARYKAAGHTWRKLIDSECWVGWDPEHMPTPEQLARGCQIKGPKIRIEWTDSEWMVPLARTLVESSDGMRWVTMLPEQYDLSESGQWVFAGVRPRFRRLFEIASGWYEVMAAAEGREGNFVAVDADPVRLCNEACEVLGYNYRVGRLELVALGVTGTDFWRPILDATIDLAGILDRIEARQAAEDPLKKTADFQHSAA